MNPIAVLRGRENEAPTDSYTPEIEGVAPFPLTHVYDRLREAAVNDRLERGMTAFEAHAVFVDVFDEGISRDELETADRHLVDDATTHEIARELTDAYARDYATNSIPRQLFDAAAWTGARGLHRIGLATESAAEKAAETADDVRNGARSRTGGIGIKEMAPPTGD